MFLGRVVAVSMGELGSYRRKGLSVAIFVFLLTLCYTSPFAHPPAILLLPRIPMTCPLTRAA